MKFNKIFFIFGIIAILAIISVSAADVSYTYSQNGWYKPYGYCIQYTAYTQLPGPYSSNWWSTEAACKASSGSTTSGLTANGGCCLMDSSCQSGYCGFGSLTAGLCLWSCQNPVSAETIESQIPAQRTCTPYSNYAKDEHNSKYYDSCISDSVIKDYYCDDNLVKSKQITCSALQKCEDGVCVSNILSTPSNSCTANGGVCSILAPSANFPYEYNKISGSCAVLNSCYEKQFSSGLIGWAIIAVFVLFFLRLMLR